MIEKINKLEIISEYTTISVVYIVKNERDYIIKSLLSILDLADEIIIVDTGSEDNTLDLIKKMCDKKIKYLHLIGVMIFQKQETLQMLKQLVTGL
ncbi:TPA: glycosyltransferase [Staphylococcus pseudintermedius]|nr:glycosyltransferase [Staphylococcus pseudintermedius]